jgi:hypothetical protein
MRRTLSLIVLLVIVASLTEVYGQANFSEGRVITAQSDTLFGLIKDGFTPRNSKICIFKEDKKAKAIKYYPQDLKSYQIAGGVYYASKEVLVKDEIKQVFALVLLEGDLNLYHQREDKENSYFIQKDQGELIALVNRDREYEITSN